MRANHHCCAHCLPGQANCDPTEHAPVGHPCYANSEHDQIKHVVVVKHIATGYVTSNWKYDDLDWARWKKAEIEFHDRRNHEFVVQIVSI